jgi:hypothetical protein
LPGTRNTGTPSRAWNPATKEEIAAVHHQIDFSTARRLQRPLVVGEKIRAPSSPRNPGPRRVIDPQMGVGKQKQAGKAE